MKAATRTGVKDRRNKMICRLIGVWIVFLIAMGITFVYEEMRVPQVEEGQYIVIEDEPPILGSYEMLAKASGVRIVVAIVIIVVLGFAILSFVTLRHSYKVNQGQRKQKELKARRVDVGVSLDSSSDVEEILMQQTRPEKVSFSRTVKVLLVEDNQINMDVAQYMLEEAGLYVHLARDGKEAVDMFNALKPSDIDVILMDVMMPEMDGIEATQLIRAMDKENSKTIPIIALTASQNEDDIRRTKEAGMNEYLNKPFDIDLTLETIQKYIQ